MSLDYKVRYIKSVGHGNQGPTFQCDELPAKPSEATMKSDRIFRVRNHYFGSRLLGWLDLFAQKLYVDWIDVYAGTFFVSEDSLRGNLHSPYQLTIVRIIRPPHTYL